MSLDKLDLIKEGPPVSSGDDMAEAEQNAKYSDHKRKQRVKNTLNWIFIVFIVVASGIAISVISIRLIHLVLSPSYQWLSADQIQGIDKLFFSGAIGGILVSYFKKSND